MNEDKKIKIQAIYGMAIGTFLIMFTSGNVDIIRLSSIPFLAASFIIGRIN